MIHNENSNLLVDTICKTQNLSVLHPVIEMDEMSRFLDSQTLTTILNKEEFKAYLTTAVTHLLSQVKNYI